jgi:UDP-N-acetylmuramoylalanine--D-glutamate ligase
MRGSFLSEKEMDRSSFHDKRVLIMGLGKFGGGLDCAIFAHSCGAKVTVTDLASAESLADALESLRKLEGIEYHLGGHIDSDFQDSDIIIVNPAVPPENSYLEIARLAGRLITSQIEIFFQLSEASIIGITGANGKSTTTALTAHLLEAGLAESGKRRVHLAGNIGNRPLLAILDKISSDDLVVLEISSFQAEQLACIKLAPYISVITNLTPNHLDRHGTFEAYCQAKESLFKYQALDTDSPSVSIFNAEDVITSKWFDDYSKQDGRRCVTFSADDVGDDIADVFTLAGRMNRSNLAAAMAVAGQFNISRETLKLAASTFKGLADRLELVAEINGVRWYNDSISTTPDSSIAALDAFDEPAIIIAGGYDKKLPFDDFGRKIGEKAKAAILIGTTAEKIANCISDDSTATIKKAGSMDEAVRLASEIASPGDVVLMSPACASYDMFDNYRQRGKVFTDLVKSLNR